VGRRGGIVGTLVAAAAAFACAPAAAQAAHSELLYTRKVAPGVTRYSYRYGPLVAAPGHNLILVGPVTIEKPAGDGYMVRYKPGLVGADGVAPPVELVHMHHAVLLNLSGRDRSVPTLPERIGGFAEEKTIMHLPRPYGYRVHASDVWGLNYMLHNETADAKTVWVTYDIDWVPLEGTLGRSLRPAHPIWLDVQNGKAYPVFDALRGSGGSDGRLTYPSDVHPYGRGPHLNQWRADRDMTLVATVGHLHPGGLRTDLTAVRGRRHAHLFRSNAHYFDPGGPISWDLAMTYTPASWRVAIHRGDRLDVSTTYETRRASWYESMGLMLVFAADGAHGPDPFRHRVDRPGRVTHGHLREAGNHGGAPTGLPDPRKEPDGATIDNGVAIADFTYVPGDLASGTASPPPVVQQGQSLQFGNFDASASILHTVTACRLPCNRSTGVSYPLANGPVQFDSAQLGYGPPGLTAASDRVDWRTPAGLRPGTYTYFCRVHPFMRGAFRVRRAN
jgi:plastocyanin